MKKKENEVILRTLRTSTSAKVFTKAPRRRKREEGREEER